MPSTYIEVVTKEVKEMLKAGIIVPLSSACSFPVVIATKEDGSSLVRVDYRQLNRIM